MTITVDITSTLLFSPNAVGDGVTDDSEAFRQFNIWARSQTDDIVLFLPSGMTFLLETEHPLEPGSGPRFAWGVKKLVVSGYGATIQAGTNTILVFGGLSGLDQGGENFARVDTARAGNTSVTLKNISEAARFSVNTWAVLVGFDLQGSPSAPANPQYFDYVYITDITNDIITFESPLVHSYLDTWPVYYSGITNPNHDCGGPATLFALTSQWDVEHEYNGVTIKQGANAQLYSPGRKITFRDVVERNLTAPHQGLAPSANMELNWINVDQSACSIEVDKIIKTFTISGSNVLTLGSNNPGDLWIIDNSTVGSVGSLFKNTIIRNSSIGVLSVGTQWGAIDELTCSDSTIGEIQNTQGGDWSGSRSIDGIDSMGTFSDGVFTIPKWTNGTEMPSMTRWAVPGKRVFWTDGPAGGWKMGRGFNILSVVDNGDSVTVNTDWSGGYPDYPNINGHYHVLPHPCPKLTVINCSGCDDIVDLCNRPGQPYGSYSKRDYGNSLQHLPTLPTMWGDIVAVNITVSTPYTTGSATLQIYAVGLTSASAQATYNFLDVNITVASATPRSIKPSGFTGRQSGDDDLTMPSNPFWLQIPGLVNQYNIDISGGSGPVITVEISLDQGLQFPWSKAALLAYKLCNHPV